MNSIPLSQVNIISVGVENYKYFHKLKGPKNDIERFSELLTLSPDTALYKPSQLVTLLNPDIFTLQNSLNDYVINRSAEGDVLIFYFSGHGVPIGLSDFGFCTTDSRIHDTTGSILPLTVLKLKDLLETLRVMNVIPIVIIDACYSGIAGNALEISPNDMADNARSLIARQYGTNYAFFCACTDRQTATGDSKGGMFSKLIFDIMSKGIISAKKKREHFLNLRDIYEKTQSIKGNLPFSAIPQLFLGDTLPEIPIAKNIGYSPLEYKFTPYLKEILLALWNNGEERELKTGEILDIVGRGAYGNHSKLSLNGWKLVDNNPITKKRRLTDRGRQFLKGELAIPNKIIYDLNSDSYIPAPFATYITTFMI